MRGSEHSAKVTRRLHWIAHIGYASRGLLFLSIGILALLAAADSHRQTVGWTGALRVLGQSFGTPLLAVLLLGLIFFSVWRILQAYLDMDGLGDKPLALAKRVVFAITGIFYSLAALWILWVLFGFAARQKRRCAAPTLDILGTASSIRPVVLGLRRNDGSWNRCGFRHQSLDGSFGSKARRQIEDEGLAAADDALCLSCASIHIFADWRISDYCGF